MAQWAHVEGPYGSNTGPARHIWAQMGSLELPGMKIFRAAFLTMRIESTVLQSENRCSINQYCCIANDHLYIDYDLLLHLVWITYIVFLYH